MTPSKPARLGPFLGLSNRRSDFELHSSDRNHPGDFLARAENVDITDPGNLKRRPGYVKTISGADCHSLWDAPDGSAFYADGNQLKHVTSSGGALSSVTVRSDLPIGRPLAYAHDGLTVVYTDGVGVYRVVGSTSQPIAPPPLAVAPAVAPGAGGSLPSGLYEVCFTFADAAGREGPATDAVQVVVAAGGTLNFSGLPALPPGVVSLQVYMSPPNGDLLFLAAVLAAFQPSLSIAVLPPLTRMCMTRNLHALPAGSALVMANGRLHSASGSTLYYSEPFMPGLYRPESGYVLFTSPIATLASPTNESLYVVTEQDALFLKGNIADTNLRTVLPYGGVPRTGGSHRNKQTCWWMSTRGLVTGDGDGNVSNRQEDEIEFGSAQVGALLYRQRDGMRQVLATTFGAQPAAAAVGSWAEAEVIHERML